MLNNVTNNAFMFYNMFFIAFFDFNAQYMTIGKGIALYSF